MPFTAHRLDRLWQQLTLRFRNYRQQMETRAKQKTQLSVNGTLARRIFYYALHCRAACCIYLQGGPAKVRPTYIFDGNI